MESRNKTIVPWKNTDEFISVYNGIFGPLRSAESRKQALARLQAWEIRRSSKCPAAVSATKIILDVMLKDEENADHRLSDGELTALFGWVVVKFMNFIHSSQTDKARTMYNTAKSLGIDPLIVEMRHICSHSVHMPDLTLLRIAAENCMDWLHENFWEKYNNFSIESPEDKDELHTLLMNYAKTLECHMSGETSVKKLRLSMTYTRCKEINAIARNYNINTTTEMLDAIVKDIVAYWTRNKHVDALTIIKGLRDSNSFFKIDEKTYKLEKLLAAVQPFFKKLAKIGLLDEFYKTLIHLMEKSTGDNALLSSYSFWASVIVKGRVILQKLKEKCEDLEDQDPSFEYVDFTSLNKEDIPIQLKSVLVYSGVDIKRTLIIGDSDYVIDTRVDLGYFEQRMKNINKYTAPVLKALMPLVCPSYLQPSLNVAQIDAIISCIDVYVSEKPQNKWQPNEPLYHVGDLLALLDKHGTSKFIDIHSADESLGSDDN